MKVCEECKVSKPLTEFPKTDHFKKLRSIKFCIDCCEIKKSQRQRCIKINNIRKQHYRAVTKYKQSVKGRASEMLRNSKIRAKEYQREFKLTREFIIEKLKIGRCEQSGIKFDLSANFTGWQNPFSPSLDRKDNRKGYTLDNVQVVCTMFNVGKSEHDELDFIAMCMAVAERNKDNVKAIERLNELRNA